MPFLIIEVSDEQLHQMQINNPQRYEFTRRVGNYGEREAVDLRTGERGVVIEGIGFVDGGYVRSDGRVEFDHPWQNPYHGMAGAFK